MAKGSRKWFKYTTDDGDIFAMQCDEANQEALSGNSADYTGLDTTKYAVPSNVVKRMAYYGRGAATVSIVVPTLAGYNTLGPGSTVTIPVEGSATDAAYVFIRKRPETISYPRPDDTGLNDGDAS